MSFAKQLIFKYVKCYNPASSNFLERAETSKISGVTSTLVVQEVTHRMMIVEAAAILTDIKAKDVVKYLKIHPDIVKKLVSHQSVPEKIASFNLEIISPDMNTIERSQQAWARVFAIQRSELRTFKNGPTKPIRDFFRNQHLLPENSLEAHTSLTILFRQLIIGGQVASCLLESFSHIAISFPNTLTSKCLVHQIIQGSFNRSKDHICSDDGGWT